MAMKPKKAPPTSEEELELRGVQIVDQLFKESDRGKALLAGVLLDENLEILLRAKMRSEKELLNGLFEGFGPLATFSAKIKISYALFLIEKETYCDLEIIREIRNHFAHHYRQATFYDDWVGARVKTLKLRHTDDKALDDYCFRMGA